MRNKLRTTAIMAAFLVGTAGIAFAQAGTAPGGGSAGPTIGAGGAARTGYNNGMNSTGTPGLGAGRGTSGTTLGTTPGTGYGNGMNGAGTQGPGGATSGQGSGNAGVGT